jgi:hypothetical protein
VLDFPIGPQAMNFGNHVDHAALAEVLSHAFFLAGQEPPSPSTLYVQYVSPGTLGQTLECYLDHEGSTICAFGKQSTREDPSDESKPQLVVMGKLSSS